MMKHLFSLPYFKDTLKRCRVFIFVCLAISIVGVAGSLGTYYVMLSQYLKGNLAMSPAYMTLGDVNSFASLFAEILAPILTVTSFSYLTKRNEADFYESLPISRRARAVTGMITAAVASLVIILASSLLAFVGVLPCLGKVISFGFGISVLQLLGYILITLLTVSVATLAVALTGTVKFALLTAFTVLAAPRIILACVNGAVGSLEPTLVSGHIIPLFDNGYNLFTADIVGNTEVFTSPLAFVYTLLLAAVYAVLAVYTFEHRPSETATHTFSKKWVRYAYIILISTVLSSLGLLVAFLGDFFIALGISLIFFAAVVYFIIAAVLGKGEKHGASTVKAFGIFAGVNAVLVAVILISAAILGAYSPSADRIKSVSVISDAAPANVYITYEDYVLLRADDIRLDSEETKKAVAAALDRGSDINAVDHLPITMKIRTGLGSAYRTLYFTDSEYAVVIGELSSNEEYRALWLDVEGEAEYPSADVASRYVLSDELLSAVTRDAERMGFDSFYSEVCEGSRTNMEFSYLYRGSSLTVTLPITEGMTETYEVYKKLYSETVSGYIDEISEKLDRAARGESEHLFLLVSYFDNEENYYFEVEISPSNTKSSATVEQLISFIGTEYTENTQLGVDIYEESLFGDWNSYSFGIADGVTYDELMEFFKSYGADSGEDYYF